MITCLYIYLRWVNNHDEGNMDKMKLGQEIRIFKVKAKAQKQLLVDNHLQRVSSWKMASIKEAERKAYLMKSLPSQWVPPHGSIPAIWNATELKWLLEHCSDGCGNSIKKEKRIRGGCPKDWAVAGTFGSVFNTKTIVIKHHWEID